MKTAGWLLVILAPRALSFVPPSRVCVGKTVVFDCTAPTLLDDPWGEEQAPPDEVEGTASSFVAFGGAEDDLKAEARMARQQGIRETLNKREPHQRRDCVRPGLRVLVVQNADSVTTTSDEGTQFEVRAVTEGIVEDIITKERSHPLGVKVRCVGNFAGRVQKILGKHEKAEAAAAELGVKLVKADKSRGIRAQIMAADAQSRYARPFSTSADRWVPTGPAAAALEALEALERAGEVDVDQAPASGKKRKGRKGESGAAKMRRMASAAKHEQRQKKQRRT